MVRLEVIDPFELDGAARTQWDALHETQPPPANPFCAPEWVITWYRHFVQRAEDRMLVLVRTDEGRLVGVAPYFLHRHRLGRLPLQSRLRLAGSGQGSSLLEMPQVLTAPGEERRVLAALVEGFRLDPVLSVATDWFDLAIGQGQGWPEPQWFTGKEAGGAFWRHADAQACVVMPLQGSWQETQAALKRNVKESLRRSRNRLAKQELPYRVVARSTDLDMATVDRFLTLHRARADQRVTGSAVHPDAFADPLRRAFMRELLPQLGAAGRATMWELWLSDRQVAVQLVLHSCGTVYVHSSGVEEDVWELGPVTHLQEHAFRAGCERGDTWVNFSPGPNLAKLRWSEQLLRHDEFAIGFGGRRTLLRHAAFAAGQVLQTLRHHAALAARKD